MNMPLTPEVLVPRIGDTLLEQKLLTKEQLNEALSIQEQERSRGNAALIGQILVEHGYISQEILNNVVTQQIFQLHNALQQANATLEARVKDRTRELEIAYQKLSELTTLKANFVSNISHELRTPLTHIKGYISLLVAGGLDGFAPDQQYAIKTIEKASEKLSRLIEDLILFSTSETNSLQVNNEFFNIVKTVRGVIEQRTSLAQGKSISLQLRSEKEIVLVNSDPKKVQWVINHLVENAIKFTGTGGEVTLTIGEQEAGILVSVQDTGMGIPPEKLEEIFEPFHQLDESSTRHHGGTGLGLSLARKIVESLGSSLNVTSSVGHGSTFSFILQP